MPTDTEMNEAVTRAAQAQVPFAYGSVWLSSVMPPVTINVSISVPTAAMHFGTAKDALGRRDQFDRLVKEWRRETAHISSVAKTSMHPAYQTIIGMGKEALPFIFEELERRGGHWFWALRFITQEDPASGCSDLESAKAAWLSWWDSRRRDH